jgi:hypothetical protein
MNTFRAGVIFLLLQTAVIVYAQFTPQRYFCWAPFHAQSKYQLRVWLKERELTDQEISTRYRQVTIYWDAKKHEWWELNDISHVFGLISQYESTYGATDQARVEVTYNKNGLGQRIWTWPTP